jgi:DNA-binding NarL/FixJ family response regulator
MDTENSSARAKKIVVIDDHPLVRERLIELVTRERDLEIVGEADDRADGLELIGKTGPDLAIIDLSLKSSLGFDLIKDLQILHPEVLVLVVSMQDEMIYAERCIRAGARGYITKQEASRHVMLAIRKVLGGDIYLSAAVTGQILNRSIGRDEGPDFLRSVRQLTDRELQVFELVGKGQSSRQIAERLNLDVKTVETYRARVKEKLGIKESGELLQRAIAWVHQRAE